MPRLGRIVAPGVAHHVTQRGNNREDIFFDDDDRLFYLNTLNENSIISGLKMLGYCLMSNHIHLLCIPENEAALAKAIGRTNILYTRHINPKYDRSGHLWQNRFFSCPLDDAHLVCAMAYIERNPVRAGLVAHACSYKWSSAKAHIDLNDESKLLDLEFWGEFIKGTDWKEYLEGRDESVFAKSLQSSTAGCKPMGNDAFIGRIEDIVGRTIRSRPVGRPRRD